MTVNIKKANSRLRALNRGDTIIEVLIAIAIAAFAIGTAYAIANRSLQRAITARERNEALNNIQSQVSALKFREKTDPLNFDSGFSVPASFGAGSFPATAFHFCLDDQSTSPSDSTHTWTRFNNNIDDSQANTLTVGNPGYDARCKIPGNGTDFYIDIAAQVTATSQSSKNRTVYRVSVRWAEVGTGALQQSSVYYRF
jgi:type II secretory pathway pseudopilin PulG